MTRFRTAFPAEQNYAQWAQKEKERRWEYWRAVHRMREEYMNKFKGVTDLTVRPSLHFWAEEQYGIKMGIDGSGDYTGEYTVADPKKFLMFQLKYWG